MSPRETKHPPVLPLAEGKRPASRWRAVPALIAGSPLGRLAGSRTEARDLLLLSTISLFAALVFFLPFWLRLPSWGGIPFSQQDMKPVYGMWDAPFYVTVAASLYDPDPANPAYAWLSDQPSDYAERFPLYPLAIRLLSPIAGLWNSGLVVNILASTAITLLLYMFLRRFGALTGAAFPIAAISIFWPPRGFLYRYVTMADPMFILGLLGAAYFFKRSRFVLSGLFGAMAVASRPNSFLVVGAFALIAIIRLGMTPGSSRLHDARNMAGLFLMPLTLGAVYLWHQVAFGDWLASLHASNFVKPELSLYPPLSYFGVGDEGMSYLFLLALAGTIELARRRHWELALLSAAFYIPVLFVPTDASRYLLPVLPFAYFVAGERVLAARPLQIALVLSIPMVYVYAWTTMLHPYYQAPIGLLRSILP